MPWSEHFYPPAMRNLDPVVRERAIHVANALLEDGRDEGFAIRVGISCAQEWARRRSLAAAAMSATVSRRAPRSQ